MTILTKQEMIDILGKLAVQGNTYTCEAQFQFDLAYALRKYFETKKLGYNVYLEYPQGCSGKTEYFDIVVEDPSVTPHDYCVIELKYKTKAMTATCYGQKFSLKTHAAQGLGRYDYLYDVARIESFSSNGKLKMQNGFAILLTNDGQYWQQDGNGKFYVEFSLKDNTIQANGHKGWPQGISPNSTGVNRINGFDLEHDYQIDWDTWDNNFKYLLLEIK